MSEAAVRAALETQLATITPAIATAYENQPFTPPAVGIPYQEAFVLFAKPLNEEMGSGHQLQGILHIRLCYPLGQGSGPSEARAALIKAAFRKASTFTSGMYTVSIPGIVEKGNGSRQENVWATPVKVPFLANRF